MINQYDGYLDITCWRSNGLSVIRVATQGGVDCVVIPVISCVPLIATKESIGWVLVTCLTIPD